jgi:hypothetical protein
MRPADLVLAASLLACIACTPAPVRAREARSGPYALEVVDEAGRGLPAYRQGGRTFVLGRLGQRYLLRVRNGSGRRIEVVASVDGRDVLDGRPASVEKRGYLVEAFSELTIDGFRLSQDAVAAFRFSSVPDSYAARMGDAGDVGVIGLAVFPERPRPVVRMPAPLPFDHDGWGRGSAPSGAPSASAPEAMKSEGPERRDRRADAADRPGLGTAFGEEHGSRVEQVPFERASGGPAALLSLRYDDERGLLAQGIDVQGHRLAGDEAGRRRAARPFPSSYAEPPPGW